MPALPLEKAQTHLVELTALAMLFAETQDRVIGLWRQALRFVLPVGCIGCGASLHSDPVPFFCRSCWSRIVPLQYPSCSRCDQPFVSAAATQFVPDRHCQSCIERPPAYQRAWTLFPYVPPLQEAICSFKYRGKVALAKPLASLMIGALRPEIQADIIMPVPLHIARLRTREFNQSLLLADHLSRHLKRPVSASHLVRVRATDPQTTLSRRERVRNLRHAFAVRSPETLAGLSILLVDDVFTTGTTVNECAKSLLKAGAKSVSALTLARTIDTDLVPDRILAEHATRSLTRLEM